MISECLIACLLTGTLVGCAPTTDITTEAVQETDSIVSDNQETAAESSDVESDQVTETEENASTSNRMLTFLPDEKPRLEDDYFAYVNFDTITNAKVATGEARWNHFTELDSKIKDNLSQITQDCVENASDYAKDSPEQKIAAMYLCAVDTEGRDHAGLASLEQYTNEINQAETIEAYLEAICRIWNEIGYASLFQVTVRADDMDSSKNSIFFMSTDLGLDKDYFLNESMGEYTEIYQNYMTKTLMNYGYKQSEAEEKTEAVYQFQNELAKVSFDKQEYYQVDKFYNPLTLQGLQEVYQNIDVEKMLNDFGIGSKQGQKEWILMEIEQAKKLNEYMTEENLPMLKDYSTFILLNDMSQYLSSDYKNAKNDFTKAMNGVQDSKSEERIATELVQKSLSLDFGKIYVEQFFSSESKADIKKMIDEIMTVYRQKIEGQSWMSEETKERAKKKLDTMVIKIGYPDEWPTYMDDLVLKSPEEGGSLIDNQLEIDRCRQVYGLSKLSKPVDKTEWDMTPQTVNAYYNPTNNEIVFPAAILQPPYYNKDADRAVNLGGIGMVIGHEITHAFDSSGSLYDENGNYNVWWSEEEYEEFEKLQQSIIEYYSGFEIFPGHFVNGKLTLTENIADLGSIACMGQICGDDPKELQKMYENFANIWAVKQTEAMTLNLLNNDVHSPGKARVNAVLSSSDSFYIAYPIEEEDKMYVAPEDRVGIW